MVMYEGIFVFGSKLFETSQSDAISSLPLELSWKIFLYLDGASLRNATRANKLWGRIIMAHKKMRIRLNQFELALKLGSKKLVRFCKKNKKLMRKLSKENNYLPVAKSIVESTKTTVIQAKRGGEDFIIHAKRFKRYLDGASLRNATRANKLWGRIIMAHKKMRIRLNQFELALKLGSKKLVRFCKKNKKLMRKLSKENNYLPVAKSIVESTKTTVIQAKRGGEDFIIHAKRFKRF